MQERERNRLIELSRFEKEAYDSGVTLIAGVDEVGRGPLAGPVVAAACILPQNYLLAGLNDSKKVAPEMREKLYQILTTDSEIIYAIGIVDEERIDQLNIYRATLLAMQKAIEGLEKRPGLLLVDGNAVPYGVVPSQCIVKGDTLSISIAAASIIAKVTRDRLMISYDRQWPQYGFKSHKGYATPQHIEAVKQFGPCPIHRRSFETIKQSVLKDSL